MPMKWQGACPRDASAPTRTWRALQFISPRAPAIMWSALPSRSMAASSMPIPASREMGGIVDLIHPQQSDWSWCASLAGEGRATDRHSDVRVRLAPPNWQNSHPSSSLRFARPFPRSGRRINRGHVSIFTYSKSPGLLLMPTLGGEIQEANSPALVTGVISEAIKSPSAVEGSHAPFFAFHAASSISTPSGVA